VINVVVYDGFDLLVNTKLESHFIDRNSVDDLFAIVLKTNRDLVASFVKMIIDQLKLPDTMPQLPVKTLVFLVFSNPQLAVQLLDQSNLYSVRHT
jgi:hypothetical protein